MTVSVSTLAQGWYYHDSARGLRSPVDVIVLSRDGAKTLLYNAGWQHEDELVQHPTVLRGEPDLSSDESHLVFPSEPRVTLTPPDSQEEDRILKGERYLRDAKRGTYVSGLLEQARKNPDFNFNPWIRHTLKLPRIDVLSIEKETAAGLREIGGITLLDQNNKPIDALVIDERGSAETLDPEGWLTSFIDQWGDTYEQTTVAEFLQWVSEQDPYGPFRFGEKYVGRREGTLEEVAVSFTRR